MPLEEGQVEVNGLVMGPGTQYPVKRFDPWSRTTRADHTGDNPWSDGGYSGAEWLDVATVPITVRILGANVNDWQQLHWALTTAFAPVGTGPDVELRWRLGGIEYLMRGRPQVVRPRIKHLRTGEIRTEMALRCDDPLIYSGQLHEVTLGLPRWQGGLHVDTHVPADIDAIVVDGIADITNAGSRPARLLLRVEGPADTPTIQLDGATLTLAMVIPAGHWVDIDTVDRIVLYDGTTSRLSDAFGTWPVLPSGTYTLRWAARNPWHPDAQLIARWRDTY